MLRPLAFLQQENRWNVGKPPTLSGRLARRELKDEFLGAHHAKLIPCDSLHVDGVAAQRLDFAFEGGDFADQLLVGLLELLELGPEVPVPWKPLFVENQGRNCHDGHHHEGERKKGGTGSHGAEPAGWRCPKAIFRPIGRA